MREKDAEYSAEVDFSTTPTAIRKTLELSRNND